MLLLLEGPDGAGKSTLAQRLASAIDGRRPPDTSLLVRHKGPPLDHPLIEYVEPLLSYVPDGTQHVICDRWHVGESVYPSVFNRSTQLDYPVRAWIELFLASRGALLVYVRRDVDILEDVARRRGDDPTAVAQLRPALNAFDREVNRSLLPAIMVGETISDEDLSELLYAARQRQAAVAHLVDAVTYVGGPQPRLLLVGDQRGASRYPEEYGRWPAFAPFPATSGHYLLRALTIEALSVRANGLTLGDVALVNANDVDNVQSIWLNVGQPPVVALGENAARQLTKINLPHRRVPHPQYWRRFHHHSSHAYRAQLIDDNREAVDA